jgi:hypothetical protein
MKRLALMLLMAAVAFAGELTGKWTGSFDTVGPDGSTNPGPAYLDLKLVGQTVTGTVGPNESDQKEISNGKLDGNKLTFELVHRPDRAPMKFDLVFDGETIKGTVSAEKEGQQMRAKLDVKRKQ